MTWCFRKVHIFQLKSIFSNGWKSYKTLLKIDVAQYKNYWFSKKSSDKHYCCIYMTIFIGDSNKSKINIFHVLIQFSYRKSKPKSKYLILNYTYFFSEISTSLRPSVITPKQYTGPLQKISLLHILLNKIWIHLCHISNAHQLLKSI